MTAIHLVIFYNKMNGSYKQEEPQKLLLTECVQLMKLVIYYNDFTSYHF